MSCVSTSPETQTTNSASSNSISTLSESTSQTSTIPQRATTSSATTTQGTNIFTMNFIDHLTQQPPLMQQQQQQQQHPFFHVRDGVFHALFCKVALAYARAVPASFRVALEVFALFKVKHTQSRYLIVLSFEVLD